MTRIGVLGCLMTNRMPYADATDPVQGSARQHLLCGISYPSMKVRSRRRHDWGAKYSSVAFTTLLLNMTLARAWNVLVMGGSGFRGYPTTDYLARLGHNVTQLSRGKDYWGNMKLLEAQHVTQWNCNRTLTLGDDGYSKVQESGLAACLPLVESTQRFDAVVDFSSKSADQMKQAVKLLKNRVGIYIFMSSHAVYDVSLNKTHSDPLAETDAKRPGRQVSPMDRYALKGRNPIGDAALECEEELLKQYNGGGFPFVALRLASAVGPKENTIRYWLIHLWLRANIALTFPMHLDEGLLDTPISFTYTLDIAPLVVRVISKALNETCCPTHVEGEAFNLAAEETPSQRILYNKIGEPMGLPYVETQVKPTNQSIVLYPDIFSGPVSIAKATDKIGWSPTDLGKALRSVARFYDRIMLDESKYKHERDIMYNKCKKMLGEDGPRFVHWIREYYAERRKKELYDELDDEDDIILYRPDVSTTKNAARRRRRKKKKIEL